MDNLRKVFLADLNAKLSTYDVENTIRTEANHAFEIEVSIDSSTGNVTVIKAPDMSKISYDDFLLKEWKIIGEESFKVFGKSAMLDKNFYIIAFKSKTYYDENYMIQYAGNEWAGGKY